MKPNMKRMCLVIEDPSTLIPPVKHLFFYLKQQIQQFQSNFYKTIVSRLSITIIVIIYIYIHIIHIHLQ